MTSRYAVPLFAFLFAATQLQALQRPERIFEIFQFPADAIPRIDGQIDDWSMVPPKYAIGADELMDTVKGKGVLSDPADLDISVKVGWVAGLNRHGR